MDNPGAEEVFERAEGVEQRRYGYGIIIRKERKVISMPLLLKNCNIFAPEPLGVKDILIEGERIALIASDLDARNPAFKTEVIDFSGAQ